MRNPRGRNADDPGVQGGWKQDPNDEAHDHDIGSASYVQSATCRLVDWMIPHSSTRAFPVLLPLACLCADLASSALLRLPPNQGQAAGLQAPAAA
jgi:hypothetical protein